MINKAHNVAVNRRICKDLYRADETSVHFYHRT
jgi:hypothetical protein